MRRNQSQRNDVRRLILAAAVVSGLTAGSAGHAAGDDPPGDSNETTPLQEVDDASNGGGLGLTYVSGAGGVMVAEVREGGPAAEAGIEKGDRIVSIGGDRIRTSQDAVNRTGGLAVGTRVVVVIERGQELLEADVTLADVPDAVRRRDDDSRESDEEPIRYEADRSVTREVNLGWELETTEEGVRIARLEAGSPAAKANLETGDIIIRVAGENVLTRDAVFSAFSQIAAESQVEVTVEREGEEISYLLKLPQDHDRDLTQGGPRETTRQRIDFDNGFRASDYEESDERQLLIEILRELRYQRQVLESLASGAPGGAPAAGVLVPGQPAAPPDEATPPGETQPPDGDATDEDPERSQRRRGSVQPPPMDRPRAQPQSSGNRPG